MKKVVWAFGGSSQWSKDTEFVHLLGLSRLTHLQLQLKNESRLRGGVRVEGSCSDIEWGIEGGLKMCSFLLQDVLHLKTIVTENWIYNRCTLSNSIRQKAEFSTIFKSIIYLMFLVTCKVKRTSDLMPYFMFGKLISYFNLLLTNLFQEMFRHVAFSHS